MSAHPDAPQQSEKPRRKTRIHHLDQFKREGKRWAMLTAYDFTTARIFDDADIPVLLIGDSAANVVYGYSSTTAITMEELIPLAGAVVRGAPHALVVADLPFGAYEQSDEHAVANAVRMIHGSGADMVKIEGGERIAPRIRAITQAGIAVMAHIGFTPQSVSSLGGFRVQGRGSGAEQLNRDAKAVCEAGASAVVLEMVPEEIAREITEELPIPTIGIGAGAGTDGQVLVWQDMAAMTAGRRTPSFVEEFGQIGQELRDAARRYRDRVADGTFPDADHAFSDNPKA